jgi:hypothetical protein
VIEPFTPQSLRQHRDKTVVLTIVVLGQRLEGVVCQLLRIGFCRLGDFAQIFAGVMEDAYHRPAAVIAALEYPKDRDRAIVVSRLRTSFATSLGLSAPANSSRGRRLVAALSMLISISSPASRSAPRASRFFALSVFFEANFHRTRENRS